MVNRAERLFIALYMDADVHSKLAAQVRARGFDAISAYELNNTTLDDAEQLSYAASQKRAILTCNARHFAPLLKSLLSRYFLISSVARNQKIPTFPAALAAQSGAKCNF
ncbi:MAG: DUF5615 family PIN-like protein [Anaerolineae bacterium]|nr:DUF5615 family PIN-like protein [Anaerolineae bacterium]